MKANTIKNMAVLIVIALLALLAVITLQTQMADKIVDAKLHATFSQIVPPQHYNNDLLADTVPVMEDFREFLGLIDTVDLGKKIHIARDDGEAQIALIPTVALDGYSSGIKMLVGVKGDGTIAGVRVTEHNETPGLADYIDVRKSNWLLTFNGKDISSNFTSRKAVIKNAKTGKYDQLTGATITRKAVILQVKKTLSYFQIAQPLEAAMLTEANTVAGTTET